MNTAQTLNASITGTRKRLIFYFARHLVIVACCAFIGIPGFQVQAQNTEGNAAVAEDTDTVRVTLEQLKRYYAAELGDLEYNPNQDQADILLQKVGERVKGFFDNFSNTASKEQVRMQRLGNNGREEDSAKQNFNYLILPHSYGLTSVFEEVRTDGKGRTVDPTVTRGFILTRGYAGMSICFHPDHQFGSHFYYLGRQASGPHAHVIAFAQKPEARDYLSLVSGPGSQDATSVLLRGIAWIDPQSYQITRLRTDLLTPYVVLRLFEQTTDIRFSEIPFAESKVSMWLPQEVEVSCVIGDITYRNRHKYSDYMMFTVESYDKINEPVIKK